VGLFDTAKISYLCSVKPKLLRGFAPDLLTRGSAPGPRWEHNSQTPTSPPMPATSPEPRVSGLNPEQKNMCKVFLDNISVLAYR